MLRACLAGGVTAPGYSYGQAGQPAPRPCRPRGTQPRGRGGDDNDALFMRRPRTARGALDSYAPSLRSPPARRLPGEECGLLAQEPAPGTPSNASGATTGATVNKGALSGPEGANSSATLNAGEGPAPPPMPQPPKPGLPKRDAGRAGARLASSGPREARERAAHRRAARDGWRVAVICLTPLWSAHA